MTNRLMILTSKDPKATRLIRIPVDYEEHEAFRRVVSLIAEVEEENPDYTVEEITSVLEDNGFELVEFVLGPELG